MDSYKLTFQTWDKLASKYQDKFMDLDLYNDTYDRFCQLVHKPGSKIFEIGCGPGNIAKYLLHKRPDFDLLAIDTAPNMIALARQNNPSAHFEVMDCRQIDSLTTQFDGIVCGFCMPYLSREDCAKLIKDCASLLNPGGILYFSAIEDEYGKSGFETSSDGQHSMFVYYHEEAYLRESLTENNFELTDLVRKVYPKSDETSSTHLIVIARKKSV